MSVPTAQARINYWALSAFWLGVSVHWAAFLTIAMQARVNDLAPLEQRGLYLAWLAAAGALISTIVELIAGRSATAALPRWAGDARLSCGARC